jgi:hypothetical protein
VLFSQGLRWNYSNLQTGNNPVEVEVKVDFATDGQSASSSWCWLPFGAHDQILNFLSSDKFLFLHVERPLWRENGSVVFSAITHWLETRRTHNHVLLSHQRLSQPGQSQSQRQSHITTDGQSVSMSWCRAQSGTFDQRFFFKITVLSLWAPSLTRGRVCHLSVLVNTVYSSQSVSIYINYLHTVLHTV